MLIRWKWMFLFAVACCMGALFSSNVVTAAPQAAAPAKDASSAAQTTASISIPDTTIAVNSATPMSQRVVHYEIEAKYDSATHTADASEVLTYHNVTGQALDHFPFHLYQNAFQPKA